MLNLQILCRIIFFLIVLFFIVTYFVINVNDKGNWSAAEVLKKNISQRKIWTVLTGIDYKTDYNNFKEANWQAIKDVFELTNNETNMNISWENTSVDVKINVPTLRIVENQIDQAINGRINSSGTRIKSSSGPSASVYYAAAVYYRQENIKLKIALEWINKAIEMTESPKFWQFRQQSLIMAANKKFSDAVDAAQKSLDLATEADNLDYVKMNMESIAEWSKKL